MESTLRIPGTRVGSAVEVQDLSLERGGKVLFKRMSWLLPAGGFMAVTGPSGSGKSSLLACVRGTLRPMSGSVDLVNNDPFSTGTVFQHLGLTGENSVLTNVMCGRLGGLPWWKTLFAFAREDKFRAYETIASLGLAELAHKPVRSISGGEQQRTAIARVLMQDPRLILADEPTSNLDAALAERVLTRFRALTSEQDKTVIAVLHDRSLVDRFADMELSIGPDYENGWMLRTISRACQKT